MEEWVEWIAAKEDEWNYFTKGRSGVNIEQMRNGVRRTGRESGNEGSWRDRGCYRCGSRDHGIAWCPEAQNAKGYGGNRQGQRDDGKGQRDDSKGQHDDSKGVATMMGEMQAEN